MIDSSAFQGKTAAYYTLGCKLNFSETSTFGKMLQEMGVRTVEKGQRADICLINTCSVTEVADQKCRQAIRRMVRENPGAFVVVTGCYAQLEADEVAAIDGVSLVLGSNEKANLIQFLSDAWTGNATSKTFSQKTKDIKSFAPSCSKGNRTRYFLKVQDGCDYFCTYCTIPYARGFSRNPTIASLVEQAREAAMEGGKEIVLTGVKPLYVILGIMLFGGIFGAVGFFLGPALMVVCLELMDNILSIKEAKKKKLLQSKSSKTD